MLNFLKSFYLRFLGCISTNLLFFNILSFSSISGLFFFLYWQYNGKQFIGPAKATFISLAICLPLYYLSKHKNKRIAGIIEFGRCCSVYMERYAYAFLIGFIVIHIIWSGLILFLNPYEWGYNQGDATFFTQTLHNMVNGQRPESSYFALGSAFNPHIHDPRYSNASGYVSVFTLHQYWVPMLVLSPLYALYPFPPMHIFSQLIVVVCVGIPGMFFAIRKMGGSKILALLGAIGYILLPQVEILLFFHGYFDFLGLALFPWVLAALFARKWWLLYITSICLAAISFPYTYTVMMIGVIIAFFFNTFWRGVIVFLIGFLVMKWDHAVFISSSLAYKEISEIPSFLKYYVLDRTIGSLIPPIRLYIYYIGAILQAGAFLPIFLFRREKKWNMPVIGLLVLTAMSFILMLFRSAGWESQRNAVLIVPLYITIFLSYINLTKESGIPEMDNKIHSNKKVVAICLSCCMIMMILYGNGFGDASPVSSHYPFGPNAKLYSTKFTVDRKNALDTLAKYVPKNASLAFLAEGNVDAVLANRQHVWHINKISREPDGVKYYVFFGIQDSQSIKDREDLITKMQNDKKFKMLYKDDSIPMVIFENMKAYKIPRQENLLGWSVLLKVFQN